MSNICKSYEYELTQYLALGIPVYINGKKIDYDNVSNAGLVLEESVYMRDYEQEDDVTQRIESIAFYPLSTIH